MKKFALVGAAGYVAPKHMKAINNTGNTLVCAYDINDSVGVLDRYSKGCKFHMDYHDFITNCVDYGVDYLTICSPNHTHLDFIRVGIAYGMKVICEKPLVIDPKHIALIPKKIFTILQLRYHPELLAFKSYLEDNPHDFQNIDLNYFTYRGDWYHKSWKGDDKKSGGINMNIGIHLFDMLIWLFGEAVDFEMEYYTKTHSIGVLNFNNASVRWNLCTSNKDPLPKREMIVNGGTIDFSTGFTDLHTKCYDEILAGRGYDEKDASKAIKLVHKINKKCATL